MKDKGKWSLAAFNVILVVALLTVIFPLLMISKYNYPSADDWSFSARGYQAIKNGEGFFGVIHAGLDTVKDNYINWEGRFCNTLFATLQPGMWGEKYYCVVVWLMIGSVIFSEAYLCQTILKQYAGKKGKWLCIPIVIPPLIMQVLYTPSAEESFFWYTGSVNYTFVYGLSLILLAILLKLGTEKRTSLGSVLRTIFACVLAILVGGNNFSTSLSCFLTLLVLSALFLWKDKMAFRRIWYLTVLMGVSLAVCILAPGNIVRINGNFNGKTGNVAEAVLMSLVRSFTNIYSWTNVKIFLMLLLMIPFLWKAVKAMDYSFRVPGLFTLVTFCLYASQAAPNMYIERGISSGRLAAILYYSYHLWIVGNVGYWMGWLSRRQNKLVSALEGMGCRLGKYNVLYCVLTGMILAGIIYLSDLHSLTSYRAYRSWRQGWAQQYAREWEERLEVLHDDSITEVYFAPLSVYPEMLLYADLQEEDGYIWVNSACAIYYGKDAIHVIAQTQ